jgi:zinc protease
MIERGWAWSGTVAVLGALLAPPAGAVAQQGGFPSRPPAPLPQKEVSFPMVGRDTLPNGLRLVVVENHEQPVVSVRLYLPGAGGINDPTAEIGLADLTAGMLDKGTATRTAAEIASGIEGLGASLNAGSGDDYAFVVATTLTRHLPQVMDIFADVVEHPTFPEDEFQTQKKRELSALQVQLSQPGVLAQRQFMERVYGEYPYGDAPTPASVGGLICDDLATFQRERYVPDRSLLVFAGDIDLAQARALATREFGAWQGGPPSPPSMPAPPAPSPSHIWLVHRPGSVQSNLWLGNLGIRPGNPDEFALDVMNRVLGGGANSRLFLILREQKGWTYGAYSRESEPVGQGYFAATTEVRTPVTDSALTEMIAQIRRIRTQVVPDSELAEAKDYLTGHFPLEIETPEQVASEVADALIRGVGIGYLEHYRSRIAAVGGPDVERVAATYLHPDSLVIVVVGDAKAVDDPLAKIAPVTLLNEHGEPIDKSQLGGK